MEVGGMESECARREVGSTAVEESWGDLPAKLGEDRPGQGQEGAQFSMLAALVGVSWFLLA
jgi:hypothetical protein